MIAVLDASVVLKWLLPEHDNAAADLLLEMFLNDQAEFHAPDLLLAEAASALWKRVILRKELRAAEATYIFRDLLTLPLVFTATSSLADEALQLAMKHRHSVYDCLYCALAIKHSCDLVTADLTLIRKFHGIFPFIRHLSSMAT